MLYSVKVIFENEKYNYSTNVNFINNSRDQVKSYFLNNYFNFGGITYDNDGNESEYDDNQQCIDVLIQNPVVKVVSGSFEGKMGLLQHGIGCGTYFVKTGNDSRSMVVLSQVKQIH